MNKHDFNSPNNSYIYKRYSGDSKLFNINFKTKYKTAFSLDQCEKLCDYNVDCKSYKFIPTSKECYLNSFIKNPNLTPFYYGYRDNDDILTTPNRDINDIYIGIQDKFILNNTCYEKYNYNNELQCSNIDTISHIRNDKIKPFFDKPVLDHKECEILCSQQKTKDGEDFFFGNQNKKCLGYTFKRNINNSEGTCKLYDRFSSSKECSKYTTQLDSLYKTSKNESIFQTGKKLSH